MFVYKLCDEKSTHGHFTGVVIEGDCRAGELNLLAGRYDDIKDARRRAGL
jgi:hypothetical protein